MTARGSAVRRAATAGVLALALSLAPAAAPGAPPGPAAEAQVEAEMVERFTRFIEWPEDALGAGTTTFVLCLAGQDAVGPRLESLARERRFKERPVEVRHLPDATKAAECHLLWIGRGAGSDPEALLARTRGRPVLTVADTAGLGERGALINLQRMGDHFGFEVNLHEVRRSRMAFSSKLLRLGTMVGPEREAVP